MAITSLFAYNKNSLKTQAQTNQVSISIAGSGNVVASGQLKDDITFSSEATWEPLLSVGFEDAVGSSVQTWMAMQGNNIKSYGGKVTQKYYNGSKHTPLTLNFRVTENVINVISNLYVLTLPTKDANLETIIDAFADSVRNTAKALESGAKAATKSFNNSDGVASGVMNGALAGLNEMVDKMTASVGGILVDVDVGDILNIKRMCLESVSFTISKQRVAMNVPLYVDVSVTLSTNTILNQSAGRTIFKGSGSRTYVAYDETQGEDQGKTKKRSKKRSK